MVLHPIPILMKATPKPILATNLTNYDPEDNSDSRDVITIDSSSEEDIPLSRRVATIKSPSRRSSSIASPKGRKTKTTQQKSTSKKSTSKRSTSVNTTRVVTPPLAKDSGNVTPPLALESFQDHPYSPMITHPTGHSELSYLDRNSVIMAMQNQIDWRGVGRATGIDVDRIITWWTRASSEIVKKG
jgi:hypothetical protein